ncbi:MAG TPA: PAS-domain containing protein [Stellaceae bacterium]|nr:PAS-domain containing protein [Stellaceae bacterium]
MILIAAVIVLAVVIGLGGLALYARSRLSIAEAARDTAERSRAGLAALLATAPVTGFVWRADGSAAVFGALAATADAGFAAFLARLDAEAAPRLTAAVDALRADGTAFADTVTGPDGAAYAVSGRRTGVRDCAVWVNDITPTRIAEAAHARTQTAAAAVRAMLEAMPVPVWRRDRNLALIDCNAAYAAALDTTREAALAEGRELLAESGRGKALELARAAAGGAPRTEARHVVIAGARHLIEITETPDHDGGTIGYAIDRTDREAAETELQRHISAHGGVLENIHAAVAIYGPDKRLKFANSAFAALWGIETDFLATGPSLDELLERLRERRRIPELADFRAFRRQQLGMFTSLIEPQQELMHLPDGRTLSLNISPHPLGGLVFVYEDVTDRLALERSYNTLIEVQRESLDNLFEGIAVVGSDGRLKLHNPAYRTLWGLAADDLEDEPHISEIVEKTRAFYDDGADNWPRLKQRIMARITGGGLARDLLDRADGSVLQVATVPLPDGNMLLSYMDVTDTQRVERALRERNEALETAGRLKSEFIANVSYELRTPLNAIIGFAEILANEYFGTLTPRQLDYSRGILDSSNRLMSLINDILDLATIEAGYMTLETSEVDVHDMLESVLTLTRERARNQNLDLSFHCPDDIGSIQADDRRLRQALFNLISNAIKFTPPGGSIRLEAERDGHELVLTVADTGVGIPMAEQMRVFEKFERGDPTLAQTGAGLGLSLVKSLIELHGGQVTIESSPGNGTIVRCHLPTGYRPPAAAAPREAAVH